MDKPLNAISRDCRRRQDLFLASYAKHGIVGLAASESGIPIGTVDYWLSNDTQGFKTRKADADRLALGIVEAEIHRRAVLGADKPIIYQGRITGSYKDWSDNLLMFRAKRLDPAYKDNYQPATTAGSSLTQINIHLHPDAVRMQSLDSASVTDSVPDTAP